MRSSWRSVVRTLQAVAFVSALVVVDQLPAFAWTAGTIDSDSTDGAPALAVSLSDHYWVAWGRSKTDDVMWARWTGASWQTQQVSGIGTDDADCSKGASAAFDPLDGTARIGVSCSADAFP